MCMNIIVYQALIAIMDIQNINDIGFAAFQSSKVPPKIGRIDNNQKIREVAENFEALRPQPPQPVGVWAAEGAEVSEAAAPAA